MRTKWKVSSQSTASAPSTFSFAFPPCTPGSSTASLKRASKPADEAYETADAIERAARLGIKVVERRFGFGRSAETGDESVGVQGVGEDAAVTKDEATHKEERRKRTSS